MLKKGTLLCGIMSAFLGIGCAQESQDSLVERKRAELKVFLEEFHEDPEEVLNLTPPQWNEDGERVGGGESIFSGAPEDALDRIRAKNAVRDWVIGKSGFIETSREGRVGNSDVRAFLRGFEDGDRAEDLIYEPDFFRDLREMDQNQLREGSAIFEPWSDSYWPKYKGQIAHRYADGGFPNSMDWATNHHYVLGRPSSSLFYFGSGRATDRLSPAEKYDALLGDRQWSLTRWMWEDGKWQIRWFGRVATWMGICHGWSAAAHMFAPTLEHPVDAVSADGRSIIRFYTSDLKALSSQLWADPKRRTRGDTRFLGYRCETRNPPGDNRGRVMDEACWDSNPGTWHLSIVNQIGALKRSFAMDVTYDFEVWNYPVYKYRYEYFNPQTLQTVQDLRQAIVSKERYTIDKFRDTRSEDATHFVGVAMDVTYSSTIAPNRSTHQKNVFKTVRYVYDLELNDNLEIIGGEWYTRAHPDFIWTFNPGFKATSEADELLAENDESWDPLSDPIPVEWSEAAKAASREGYPTARVLDALLKAGGARSFEERLEALENGETEGESEGEMPEVGERDV